MTATKPAKDLRNTEVRRNKIRENALSDRIFGAVVLILSILCFLIILYPLWFVVIASISNSGHRRLFPGLSGLREPG